MDADVVVLRAVPPQALEGTVEEPGHDLIVEAAGHDREAEPLGVQIAFERTWHARRIIWAVTAMRRRPSRRPRDRRRTPPGPRKSTRPSSADRPSSSSGRGPWR